MIQKKILFIDRDGTLIKEPFDYQIDSIDKLNFLPDVILSLLKLKDAGFSFVMVSNQDGLGTASFPTSDFTAPHELMLRILESQGITFEAIRICPHLSLEKCHCRKPNVGLLLDYLVEQKIDRDNSYVIGDRETDMKLAENMGIKGIQMTTSWVEVTNAILSTPRRSVVARKTKETSISVDVNLDHKDTIMVNTGIEFFNHMLEQLAKHAGFSMNLSVNGDIHVDDHHTIEDTAIALGEAIKKALGDKIGIRRYGFLLPMDESISQVALDLSGRSYCIFEGEFNRERVGDLSTELVSHFFRSFAEGLKATLHICVKGENNHHMIESLFKCVGRSLRQAIEKIDMSLPSTKGLL